MGTSLDTRSDWLVAEEKSPLELVATAIDPVVRIAKEMGAAISPGEGLCIHESGKHKVFVKPFITFPDLNNQTDQDILNCNPEVPSMTIGMKFSF